MDPHFKEFVDTATKVFGKNSVWVRVYDAKDPSHPIYVTVGSTYVSVSYLPGRGFGFYPANPESDMMTFLDNVNGAVGVLFVLVHGLQFGLTYADALQKALASADHVILQKNGQAWGYRILAQEFSA